MLKINFCKTGQNQVKKKSAISTAKSYKQVKCCKQDMNACEDFLNVISKALSQMPS